MYIKETTQYQGSAGNKAASSGAYRTCSVPAARPRCRAPAGWCSPTPATCRDDSSYPSPPDPAQTPSASQPSPGCPSDHKTVQGHSGFQSMRVCTSQSHSKLGDDDSTYTYFNRVTTHSSAGDIAHLTGLADMREHGDEGVHGGELVQQRRGLRLPPCRAASYRLSWPVAVPRIDGTTPFTQSIHHSKA